MVETREESNSNIHRYVPQITRIKRIVVPADWPAEFDYPIGEAPAADFFVEYEPARGLGGIYLIEAANSNLRRELKQLEASADIFHQLGIRIDNYLIVLRRLSRADEKKYKLVKGFPKPFKYIKEKLGQARESKEITIQGKTVRFIYEHEIKEV